MMALPRFPPHMHEMLPDGNGGFYRTERSRIARRFFSELSKLRQPQEQLTPNFDPKQTPDAPTLDFGIAITKAAVIEFTVKNGLLPTEDLDNPSSSPDVWACHGPFMRHIRKVTGGCLVLRPVFSPEHDLWAITLYDNYNIDKLRYDEPEERRILRQVQEITGIDEPPKWYWGPC
ncbi:hypothetical protein FA95DRAFT_804815 [Auriscalpium vulgare]|uniref:Uncharacterized protein n=1 Tax=Auriscalpium vulgare TaxID=40419 RepID=A0ACB8RA99_9AGAM|nr:hypothetical protein FA95DRAFT_804815 [Auriscalpium vulgare]